MADFSMTPVATQLKPAQGMSLGEMVNVARGVQEYQQAQQMNPVALQLRQQEAQKAAIDLGVAQQANVERKGLMEYFSDPDKFQTNGRIDKIGRAHV